MKVCDTKVKSPSMLLEEESGLLVTYDLNKKKAQKLVDENSSFKVGDEVLVIDWSGKEYKIIKKEDKSKAEEPIKEAEGTQTTDIAEKKDQSVGTLKKPRRVKKIINCESFSIPRNHKFKGFMMNESGLYTRGNYVLVNNNGKIRAVNKNKLK
ncbi:MAG: hypothetical protein J6T15_05320 [Bacilli bacterium]|nr:hypothetical protein [Bacilli bacterium]